MAGTLEGGKHAAETNKANDPDFYKKIGKMGGKRTHALGKLHDIGFAGNKERARTAGAIGGSVSKRGPKNKETS